MSNPITVDIHTPHNEVLTNSSIPDDYRIKEVIDELVDELELQRFGPDRAPIEYVLFSIRANKYLDLTTTVGNALQNGDTIRLEARSNGEPVKFQQPTPLPMPSTIADNAQEIPVVLSVLDLNRTEQISLSTIRPINELIRQIVSNYDLPPRDKLGQINRYKLKSKALGKFLLETSTLGQEGVPTLDRLTLHREEIAGAGVMAT